jgi:hypothetical protein
MRPLVKAPMTTDVDGGERTDRKRSDDRQQQRDDDGAAIERNRQRDWLAIESNQRRRVIFREHRHPDPSDTRRRRHKESVY